MSAARKAPMKSPAKPLREVSRRGRRAALIVALAAPLLMSAAAQQPALAEGGLFGALFGMFSRPPAPPPRAPETAPLGYGDRASDPQDPSNLRERYAPVQRGSAFCVRLCDGRYFPVTRASNASPAETCSSFCPATKTKIYWGGDIDHAVGDDGTSYDQLPNAYVYRDRLVNDCTCNGKDSVGLAKVDVAADPTLRRGDVVATREGLQVFNGNGSNRVAQRGRKLVPVGTDRKLSPDVRRKLTTILVAPDQ